MKFWDISMPLHEDMVVWAGQEKFKRKEIKSKDSIISLLSLSSHTGTHVDAPKHFLGAGGASVEGIGLSKLIGPCRVIEFKNLKTARRGERLLVKTSNSSRRLLEKKKFVTDYESLDIQQAKFLANKKISLVGVDYLGVEAKGAPGHPVHKTLLRAGIVIVEGLNLSKIQPGHYNLAVLPIKIVSGDGAPARAILYT